MDEICLLGDFLRERREAVSPRQEGLPESGSPFEESLTFLSGLDTG
ncbi:hypothetical protein AB0G15_39460 [Streptosporangium sp. NPDC023825]